MVTVRIDKNILPLKKMFRSRKNRLCEEIKYVRVLFLSKQIYMVKNINKIVFFIKIIKLKSKIR
jgi:hypothetical protein